MESVKKSANMKNNRKFFRIKAIPVAAIFLTFLWPCLAFGDIYWESKQVVKGIPERGYIKKTIKTYITPTKTRLDIGENVMIADFDTMTGYVLNTHDKIYLKMKMKDVGKVPDDLKKEIKVEPTDETKTIAGYKCKKYYVTFMSRKYEQWLSKDVKEYKELKKINDKLAPLLRKNPLFRMGILGRMDKLDGFPVQIVMDMGNGITKTTTLTKVSNGSIDPKFFQVPKGYKPPY